MSNGIDRQFYADRIEDQDKNNLVTIDLENEIIEYHSDIEIGRAPGYGDEEFCRAYLIAWVGSEGGYSPRDLYLEKRYTMGHPGGASAWGDVLVRRSNDVSTPYMLLEVKSPKDYDEDDENSIGGQLFDIAPQEAGVSVLAYATVIQSTDGLITRCIVIDYSRYPNLEAWKEAGKPVARDLPPHFGKPVPAPLRMGGERDLRTDVSVDEFDSIWRRLHNLLWGGHLDDNDVFEWVTRLILAKIYDEKTKRGGEEYDFQVKYQGGAVEDRESTFDRIDGLYRRAVARYLRPDKDPGEVRGINREIFGPSQVRSVVEQLQEFSVLPKPDSDQSTDLLGRFFSRVIREGFKQSKGLYLTNPNIVFFILHAIDLKDLIRRKLQAIGPLDSRAPYIIDPACGSGTFLLAAFQLIQRYVEEHEEEIARTRDVKETISALFKGGSTWAHTHIYGLDPHRSLPVAAKVNMILHQDGSGHIFRAGALLPFREYSALDDQRRLEMTEDPAHQGYQFPATESFDVVISNPPFSIELSNEEKRHLESTFKFANQRKSENLFFERWYQLLAPNGRLGVVLPESFFSVGENTYIRRFLFKYFKIKAIVHLPDVAFQPYTTTLTSLLFAQKKTRREVEEWTDVWEGKEVDLENRVDFARTRLYKKNWPNEDAPVEELQGWIEERISESQGFLDPIDAEELRNLDDIGEVVKRLRYVLTRAKDADKDDILIREVCEEFDYSFPLITVENIGFKQTKRSTRLRPNELFAAINDTEDAVTYVESVESDFDLVVDVENPQTALDYIRREVEWD